jgi:hypothetical protein
VVINDLNASAKFSRSETFADAIVFKNNKTSKGIKIGASFRTHWNLLFITPGQSECFRLSPFAF